MVVGRWNAGMRSAARGTDDSELIPLRAELRDQAVHRLDRIAAVSAGILMVAVMDDDDVARRGPVCQTGNEVIRVACLEPVEIPEHPPPSHDHVAGARRAHDHRHAAVSRVRPESLAGLMAGQNLESCRRLLQRGRNRGRLVEHQRSRMPVQRHRVTLLERAADDGRGGRGQVLVDDEERRIDAVAGQHIEQLRRRRRVRPIVEGQVDGARSLLRHPPDRVLRDVEAEKGTERRVPAPPRRSPRSRKTTPSMELLRLQCPVYGSTVYVGARGRNTVTGDCRP